MCLLLKLINTKGEFPCMPFAHQILDSRGRRCSHVFKHKMPSNHILAICQNVEGHHKAISLLKQSKDICANNHYFIRVLLSKKIHMRSLCNFLLQVDKKRACITYNSKLPIIPYPIVLVRCPMSFLIPYITLKSSQHKTRWTMSVHLLGFDNHILGTSTSMVPLPIFLQCKPKLSWDEFNNQLALLNHHGTT